MAYVYFPHLKSAMFLSRRMKVIGKISEQTFWLFAEKQSHMVLSGDLALNVVLYLWTWAENSFQVLFHRLIWLQEVKDSFAH